MCVFDMEYMLYAYSACESYIPANLAQCSDEI